MSPNPLGVALVWLVSLALMVSGLVVALGQDYSFTRALIGATLVLAGGFLLARVVYVWRERGTVMAICEKVPAQYTIQLDQDEYDWLKSGLIELFSTEKSWYNRDTLEAVAHDVFGINTFDYGSSR